MNKTWTDQRLYCELRSDRLVGVDERTCLRKMPA